MPTPPTKIHRIRHVTLFPDTEHAAQFLLVSTEDGRLVFYSDLVTQPGDAADPANSIPSAMAVAQLGGQPHHSSERIKDFELLPLRDRPANSSISLVVTCGSDGAVRVWSVAANALETATRAAMAATAATKHSAVASVPQVGDLLATYETGNRITCMVAFLMQAPEDLMTIKALDEGEENDLDESSSSDEDST
jgi:protein MAK11